MKSHRCPEHIVRLFDDADEEQKKIARARAIEWLEAQHVAVGEEVLMPNPNTGIMENWHKPSNRTV
jgi:hypothetical protein